MACTGGLAYIMVVYHLPQIPGNFGWDVNGKRFLIRPTGKFPGQTEILKR